MIVSEEDYLAHYGILRKSGRYPWGSGESPAQRGGDFLDTVNTLRKKGWSDVEIAKGMALYTDDGKPWSTTDLRKARTLARREKKAADIAMAQRLRDKGLSPTAIGRRMGINESSVRDLLSPSEKLKVDVLKVTSDMLRRQLKEKEYIDIGVGVESNIGISKEKLAAAVALLKEEGYKVHTNIKVQQVGTGKYTNMKILGRPDSTWGDVMRNRDKIRQIDESSPDHGRTMRGLLPPISINPNRVDIKYAEQGGAKADGVIYVRPGVKDVSLGKSRYAQVRIAVGGTHYLKGMAMYRDDLPDGVDLQFNTNKSSTGNKLDAMKPMKTDKDGNIDKKNPFGSSIEDQIIDPKTRRLTSVMNIVNKEGSWDEWSKNLSSQMLSKQPTTLARNQLALAYKQKKQDLDEITKITNPAVKRRLLESFADDADASAVHLKAAQLPRQRTQVILPLNNLKATEIYAPNFRNGEEVVLIRFPHGGKFEIPQLTVNNRHPEGVKLLGRAKDAVGINHKVAERLSGADFDGDTVLVIPNNHGLVKTSPALERLKGFDPQREYPHYDGMTVMTAAQKGAEMGRVSNLITDMTIRGANTDEIARAVRHSMVVIDAEKHKLNWKQSEIDNGIAQLRERYQGKKGGGAATLISRAGARVDVNERKLRPASKGGGIDPKTGKKVYEETGRNWVDAKGKTHFKTDQSEKLAETDDAHTLSSGTGIEKVYADYSNSVKALANRARLETLGIKNTPYSPSAKKIFAKEVERLDSALNLALKNAPRERQAQVLANTMLAAKKKANPDMDDAELKKVKGQVLSEARIRTGAQKDAIVISDAEWDAIQAGAITTNKLNGILTHADLDRVKELATPRSVVGMTPSAVRRAQAMLKSGHNQAEVADALGISVSTLMKNVEV